MKHWLLVSTLIIVAVVLLFRSRAVNPTLPATPTTTEPATAPATTGPA